MRTSQSGNGISLILASFPSRFLRMINLASEINVLGILKQLDWDFAAAGGWAL